jgi:hypothetical protein
MRITAKLQNMAASDILSFIPADEYRRIREEDPHPLFRAYVIGHEGVSQGRLVGGGSLIKKWFASAIKKLYDKLQYGLKIFHGHASTNEHAGRQPIGEIVGKALKEIWGRWSAIAIAYIKPEFRNLPLDVASIEADVRLSDMAGITDVDVGDITGIALGNSAVNEPGFAGATLLSQIQAFASGGARFSHGGNAMEFSLDDIRHAIKAEKLKPSDIYDLDELTADPVLKGFLETTKKNQYGAGAAHLRRTEEEFEKQKKEWESKEKTYQEKLKKQDADIAKAQIPELFSKAKLERKLTEKQAKFIERRLKDFVPQAPDKLKEELDKHLDKELDEFKAAAVDLGVEVKTEDSKGKTEKTEAGGEPDTKGSQGSEDKYIDPEKNPFIPTV